MIHGSLSYYVNRKCRCDACLGAWREYWFQYQRNNPERRAYHYAKNRATNPNHRSWPNYGGRGIKFRFESFEQFFAEVGFRPEGMTLDRIDNDGHYEPGNVRWADRSTQNRNKRPTHKSGSHNVNLRNRSERGEPISP